ncbi:MAG: MBOAT family protein [Bacteroidetes bacterium]|nr:MBOAT family protein [Bacteroidota bacterium]
MLFNSFEFFIFLPIVFISYWYLLRRSLLLQNMFLLGASYFFYGWWDWRFMFLLILSTMIDYGFGLLIYHSERHKKFYLILSIINNLGILAFFKYYNFFAENFEHMANGLGCQVHPFILNIALPVGISFYTFHGMSYVFDIYRKIIKPERNFVNYAVFVSFFPLLVAGPIERATHLLPQIIRPRKFNYAQARDGMHLILWGLFKKVVISDQLSNFVNPMFDHYSSYSGSNLVLGTVYFAFQIYCDFSGYSDIAIGTAKLFGFELLTNFKFPYFSRDIAEFWRRWHISLSSWFRDYLYIPLGGSQHGRWLSIRNIFIIFLVSGFWHGANWTFIVWGGIHAAMYLPIFLGNRHRKHTTEVIASHSVLPALSEIPGVVLTFASACFAWIFFRSPDIQSAIGYIQHIFSRSLFTLPDSNRLGILYVVVIVIIDWINRRDERSTIFSKINNPILRWLCYLLCAVLVMTLILTQYEQKFIYFQF